MGFGYFVLCAQYDDFGVFNFVILSEMRVERRIQSTRRLNGLNRSVVNVNLIY